MKRFIFLFVVSCLFGCSHNNCPNFSNVLGFEPRVNNFASVSSDKYPQFNVSPTNEYCERPKYVKVPASILVVDRLLSGGGKVALYIHARRTEGSGISVSQWENLYLNFYGTNSNFSIIDSAHFPRVERSQTSGKIEKTRTDQLDLMSQNDRTKIMEISGVTHIYSIDYARERKGPFKTNFFSGRLVDAATGKVLAVDTYED